MKIKKSDWAAYLLPILGVCLVAYGFNHLHQKRMKLCVHDYALCTSAQCIPDPEDPTKAFCFCDVESGVSMASSSCDLLQPTLDENGVRTIYSTFSFAQFDQKKVMVCPSGAPWTWCLDKPCTVDPVHPNQATCVCDIIRTGEWITLGGDCDRSTCETGYWSGASLKQFNESNQFMKVKTGFVEVNAKWCNEDEE